MGSSRGEGGDGGGGGLGGSGPAALRVKQITGHKKGCCYTCAETTYICAQWSAIACHALRQAA